MIKTIASTWRTRGSVLALAFLMATTLSATLAAGLAHAAPTTFIVTNTNDSGPGSLRQTIEDANANSSDFDDVDTINFAIPAESDPGCDAASGVCTITPTSTLPDVTQPVIVNGYTQPGASPNTQATGSNAVLKVELNGERTNDGGSRNGITISTRNSVVKGLIINRHFASGIRVSDTGGNRIEGNFIGTDASGTADLDNLVGVSIGAPDNVVGGTSAGARNVISGNVRGIDVEGAEANRNRVEGNLIGTNASGQGDLGNSDGGLIILGALNNVLGGTAAGAGNVISGNGRDGVLISGVSASGNRVLRNSISDNDKLGINLTGFTDNSSGVTFNDPGDADTGSNNLQNYPVLTSVTTSSGETTIQGTLNSSPNDTFTLQFFADQAADPSGFGEGETFVGQTNVTANAGGNVTFSFTTAEPVEGGRFVTATATNTGTGDTSEFSEAVQVEDNTPPEPQPQCSDGVDNDGDTLIDFSSDPDCESETDDSESPEPPPGCTIIGTPGEDNLIGTSENDTICGLGGNDTISGGSGDDTIRGGDGNDTISGDSGLDTLEGEGGDDTVRGGAGNDNLAGASGRDLLFGEAGNDALNARDGVKNNDRAAGGDGKDTCSADKKDRKVSC